MKNAMKKLLSLVLVAMILVSAVPFQAAADTIDAVTVVVIDNATDAEVARFDKTPTGSSAKVGYLLNYWVKNNAEAESAEFLNAYAYYADGTKGDVAAGDALVGGDRVRIRANITWAAKEPVQEPSEEPTQKPTETVVAPINVVVKSGSSDNVIWSGEKVPANGEYAIVENLLSYCWNSDWANVYTYDYAWSSMQQANVSKTAKIYAGDTLYVMLKEGSANNSGSNSNDNDDDKLTDYTKFAYPVYLNIYTDTTVGTVKKTVNITEGIAADGLVTLAEVKSVVEYYYNAVNTDKGIQYDGLYPAQGNWVSDYVADEKYERIGGLYEAAADRYVYINVMITNAVAASSGTADSSNPKTGDNIFMVASVMTVSASALAALLFLNKKRVVK